MMAVPYENTLSIVTNGNQSHDELLTYIHQARQEEAPIRELVCSIYVCEGEFGVQHPLYSFIQSTPTLEHVQFSNHASEKASIDALLDAISQNHSIHTIRLCQIDCSAFAIQKLMERKMKWKIQKCRFIGHPPTLNQSTSYAEELFIKNNDPSVMDFMASFRSWPFLRQLTIGIPRRLPIGIGISLDLQFVHLLERIIWAAPIFQELTLHFIHFNDPAMLQSFSTVVFNAPSPDLKWHLDDCTFDPNTMAVLEKIVKSEKAKSMRIKLTLPKFSNGTDNYQVLLTILSESSRVGNLDINVHNSFSMLDILPLLRQEQPFPSTYYLCTSIRLMFSKGSIGQSLEIIESIQNWTPRVKKLFLHFAFHGLSICSYDGNPSRTQVRTELIQAVRKNLHLQLVELDVKDVKDDENTKNEKEQCRALLERYCERNRKLHATLDEADSIPLHAWPYVFHLASRGGADMLYWHLRQNAGYMLNGWHNKPPPPSSPKM